MAREVALVVALAIGVAGCASLTGSCEKTPIVVAAKEERSRLEWRRGAPRTTASGTVEETSEPVTVTEYYVRSTENTWHRVSETEFKAATPQQRIEVCR